MKTNIHLTVALFLLGGFLLGGCGFQPLYGDRSVSGGLQAGVEDHFANIAIANIPDREGQFLRNILTDRLHARGRPETADFVLSIDPIREREISTGILTDATATRGQLNLDTRLRLIDRKGNETVLDLPLRSIASYNILSSQYSTVVAEDDARERALKDLATQIVTQVSLYLNRQS